MTPQHPGWRDQLDINGEPEAPPIPIDHGRPPERWPGLVILAILIAFTIVLAIAGVKL